MQERKIIEKKNKGAERKEKTKEGKQFITIRTSQTTATKSTAYNSFIRDEKCQESSKYVSFIE